MRAAVAALLLVLAGAGAALAQAPDASLRPEARNPAEAPAPAPGLTRAESRAEWYMVDLSPFAVARSVRPERRGPQLIQRARAAAQAQARGSVCGDPEIQGNALGDVDGSGACGVEGGVRVTAVAGVPLSTPATIDCRTAQTLKRWVQTGVRPAVGREGGGVASLRVVAHYACRNRNNASGGRLSEHAFGRAIDIAGIGLRDGSEITVLTGWGTRDDGAQLRQMHQAACGPFGTVLGPDANAAHRDHFHFDTARYRSGSYCR